MWTELKARSAFAKLAYRKATLFRFQDMVNAAEHNYQTWYLYLWERTTAALDLDFLKGHGFNKRIVLRQDGDDAGENASSTSAKRIKIEDRALRSIAHNAVIISVMMLEDESNRRIVGSFLAVARPVKRWHQHQNEFLR